MFELTVNEWISVTACKWPDVLSGSQEFLQNASFDVELTASKTNTFNLEKERGGRREGKRSDRFSSSYAEIKLDLTR